MAEVVIVPDAATGGALVADEIVRLIAGRPDVVLGLATGSSPLPVYRSLVERLAGTFRASARSPSTSTWAWPPTIRRATAA